MKRTVTRVPIYRIVSRSIRLNQLDLRVFFNSLYIMANKIEKSSVFLVSPQNKNRITRIS